jgi:hypothetical protein
MKWLFWMNQYLYLGVKCKKQTDFTNELTLLQYYDGVQMGVIVD